MNYNEIRPIDTSNGPGVRVSIFVSGCRHHCKNCFNQETWCFNYGGLYDEDAHIFLISSINKDFIDGLTILGGEPLEPENLNGVLSIIKDINMKFPEKNIWLYSGFTFEELGERRKNEVVLDEILKRINHLVEGRFIESKKDIRLKFRGSSNQRIYKRVGDKLVVDEKFNWFFIRNSI